MKKSISSVIAAIAFSVTLASANVSAANFGPDSSLRATVQWATGSSGQVNVSLRNGVATLFGYVETVYDENRVKRAALNYPGVDRIIDRIVSG